MSSQDVESQRQQQPPQTALQPPPEDHQENTNKSVFDDIKCKKLLDNLTISTKMSTDKLICKSPRESPDGSVRSQGKEGSGGGGGGDEGKVCTVLYLGMLQIAFGSLMGIFGVLVIVYGASLGQVGGGLWGGCLAVITGTSGVLAAARECCPLKSTPQRVAHTAFLALSLVSIAVAQLVLVLSATGLARDVQKTPEELADDHYPTSSPVPPDPLPLHYPAILTNLGLLIASAVECGFAAISAYKSARTLCECFRSPEEEFRRRENYRNALVSSWLGKHSTTPPFYVIAAQPTGGSTMSGRSKLSSNFQVTPIYPMPPPSMLAPPPMVPLIPAPLGTVPSPIIYPNKPKEMIHHHHRGRHYRHPKRLLLPDKPKKEDNKRNGKKKERQITTEEVAKTYTGLDRAIAEEFIDICESRNVSLISGSESSSPSSLCHCQHTCEGCNSNCTNSSNV